MSLKLPQLTEKIMSTSLTSLDAKVAKYAKDNNMPTNGYPWYQMFNASECITEEVEKSSAMPIGEFHAILDKHTEGFRNPENWAIRQEARESLRILGYRFNALQVWRD